MGKRIVALFSVLILLFSAVIWRLSWLSRKEDFAQAANQQSTYTLEVSQSRGMIYDCQGQSLVNDSFHYMAAVLPNNESAAALRSQFASADLWREKMNSRVPFLTEVNTDAVRGEGVEVFSVPDRYSMDYTAPHIVGYVDADGVGQTGIERIFNDFLKSVGEKVKVRYQIDAMGRALSGNGIEILQEGNRSDGVVLTLHKGLQQACERILSGAEVNGAIVVMDLADGGLRAVASAPGFDPRNVAESMNNPDSPLVNRAFGAYAVGSTFKLLVAATALEQGVSPEQTYVCSGWLDINGQIFKCNQLAGHGEIDMEQAITHSCNCYFIQLAQQIGAQNLRDMAVRFGFSKADLLADTLQTASGNLPDAQQLENSAELANFGFGQGLLTATPIQICKMIATIADGGKLLSPYLVQGIYLGGALQQETSFSANRVISEKTANLLRKFMQTVVVEGSGQLATPKTGGAGGKTASAQTGIYDEKEEEIVHAWFGGFYPAEDPQFAIVVFVENGQSGNRVAAPLFAQVADSLSGLGLAQIRENTTITVE
ncbi:MAG: penicillin-binding transpeptidase domain-containing protein [Oscillospiraceae bacterium]|jgi:penicillin-binding protein 2|nr:penicillin-binding protein 2 [Oscillospiraceae bacterium]MDD7040401.1 penicillin-binding transpeptidase domain-containing protein [Oscillospiraceae bacterium]MDY2611262.1 penicillin-binding transpeptidase domain-containing protein [Oscillospiraceae bacterium]